MAGTNYEQAAFLGAKAPHTLNALQHLVMAMADCQKSKGKRSLFLGYDREVRSLRKFEDKLRDALAALVMDGLVQRSDDAEEFCLALMTALSIFEQAYPNWLDAYRFAAAYFGDKPAALRKVALLVP